VEFWGESGSVLALGAALLLIAAFAMTTVRRMRLLGLGAGLLALAYLIAAKASTVAFVLAITFVLVNLVQLSGIWRRSRGGTMAAEERALFDQLLGAAASRHEGRLRDLMHWREVSEGEVLMRQGEASPPLIYVSTGLVTVETSGIEVGNCGEGEFVGEMSLISGHTASATVTVAMAARVAHFDRDALAQYVSAVPEVGTAITNALNRGLAAKVERMNEAVSRVRE